MARPSKYTPERSEILLSAIREGATFRLACMKAGIDEDTFARWRRRYPDFADAVKVAEGTGAVELLNVIGTAARKGEWTAAAWKLERRYPQEYGRRVTEVQGHNGGPLAFQLQPVDYRDAIAPLAPGPVADRPASGPAEDPGDGPALG